MVFHVKWRFESSKYPSFEPRKIFKCEYIECLNDNLPMLKKKKNFSITSDSKPLGSFKKKHTHTHTLTKRHTDGASVPTGLGEVFIAVKKKKKSWEIV